MIKQKFTLDSSYDFLLIAAILKQVIINVL